ncbi:MAG: nucleotide sugar dehydrogenase, partial [Dehalococcoidia bacterium]|nr:nucleotide sugar dehydrogenase [Dehalococcoidia bacterium]
CIPVDPYYLVYKAKELGYHPQVILTGRAINDFMSKHVAEMAIKALNNMGKVIKGSKVLIMGLAYKENVADIRETPVKEMVKELKEFGVEVYGYDPLLDGIEHEFGIRAVSDIESLKGIDCVILAVTHKAFAEMTLEMLKSIMSSAPILIDVRGFFNKEEAERKGFYYRTL